MSHANENEKKKHEKKSFEKRRGGGLEIRWTGTFPQNLALIRMTVSENMSSTHGWATAAARAMRVTAVP